MSLWNRKRPLRLYIYVTQEELDDIRDKAKAAGLSVGEYGRRVMRVHKVGMTPTEEEHAMVWELRRIGTNLNQIAKKMNVLGITPGAKRRLLFPDITDRAPENVMSF